MELESVHSGSRNSDLPKNLKANAQEGDARDAFLSVLQGLVGFLAPAPAVPANILQVNIAKLETKEKEVEKDTTSYFSDAGDSEKQVAEQDAKLVEDNKIIDEGSAVEKVQVVASKDISQEKEVKPEEAVACDAGENVQVETKVAKEETVVTDQAVTEQIMTVDNSASNTGEGLLATSEVVVAENTVENVVKATDLAPVSEVVEEVADQSVNQQTDALETPLVDSHLVQDDVKLDSNNTSVDPKSTIKVLNAKVYNDDGRRSLEDELEISYFNARDLMSSSSNTPASALEKAVPNNPFQVKEVLGAKAVSDLAMQIAFRGQNSFDLASNLSFQKGSSMKLDQGQGISQSNSKPVFERANSEKILNESFHARTAQAQVMIDKVKAVVEQAAVNKTNDSITVKVDPPHLGELTVKVSEKKGQIYAKITPENKEVEEILRSQTRELSLVIQALGYKEEDVEVSIGAATPDFYKTFSQSDNAQGNFSGFQKGMKRPTLGAGDGLDKSGINIDNKLTSEDLVGWVA